MERREDLGITNEVGLEDKEQWSREDKYLLKHCLYLCMLLVHCARNVASCTGF